MGAIPAGQGCEISGCTLHAKLAQPFGVDDGSGSIVPEDVYTCGDVHDLTVGLGVDLLPDRIRTRIPGPGVRPPIPPVVRRIEPAAPFTADMRGRLNSI